MKTNDHYNVLTDPNLHRLVELLREFVVEYGRAEDRALADIAHSFKLSDKEKERLRTLFHMKDK